MKKFSLILFILMLPLKGLAASTEILHYQPVFYPVADKTGKTYIALRSFDQGTTHDYLVVDPYSLDTKVVLQSDVKKIAESTQKQQGTPYIKALNHFTSSPFPLQNQGVTRALSPEKGSAFLTVDLCPSTHQFDTEFFERLSKNHPSTPFPLALSVSGRWITKHEKEYQWLLSQRREKKLDFIWVNHTFNHPFVRGIKNSENFLLLKGTNILNEILSNEKLLLSLNEVPSVFIRFPGLISNKEIIEDVKKLGLIPLGAEAWLAKGQKIHDGSVVLVHGNGNEPAGLRLLTGSVLSGRTWLPLNMSIGRAPKTTSTQTTP